MRELTFEERKFLEHLKGLSFHKRNGYFYCDYRDKHYKRSRIFVQLERNVHLELWEIVHHKDGNKENDCIENLEVLNSNLHATKHHDKLGKKPKGYKPVNALREETISRIRKIASEMVKINCSEISRKLNEEGIQVCSQTIKRYIQKGNF